ncbi:hypothetical protein [Niastella sp. OAS944]|uniref:hypothetical protein n=1 Tax=Niastella sp. OAS944 TaxID=2664089 RepID=UPI0034745192|nr:hypothetical protein [Chitinophagaceae bacterium OAS944]
MVSGLNYRLQILEETLLPVRRLGEQYQHETHYHNSLSDAFLSLLRLSIEEMDYRFAKHIGPEFARHIKEAAIIEENHSESICVQLQRTAHDINLPENIDRPLFLHFPRGIKHFEEITGIPLQEYVGYQPDAKCLLYGYLSTENQDMYFSDGITSLRFSLERQGQLWPKNNAQNFAVYVQGYNNPDLMSDARNRLGWQFSSVYHYSSIADAFAYLMQTNIATCHRYISFSNALDQHITDAYITGPHMSKIVGIEMQDQSQFVGSRSANEDLHLQFYNGSSEYKYQLNHFLKNAGFDINTNTHLLAQYDDLTKTIRLQPAYQTCKRLANQYHSAQLKGLPQGYQVSMERESLAGNDHLSGYQDNHRSFATIENAVQYIMGLHDALFDRQQAVAHGAFIHIKNVVLMDNNSGCEVLRRFAEDKQDLIKVNMAAASFKALRAIERHTTPLEHLGSPHHYIALVNKPLGHIKRKAKAKNPACRDNEPLKKNSFGI